MRFHASGASIHQSAAATNNRAGNHLNGATPARPSGAQFRVASSRDVKINRPQPQGAAHRRRPRAAAAAAVMMMAWLRVGLRSTTGSHNRARQEVGVPDLAWDDSVAAAAAEWANNLASRGCRLEHGGAEGLGQNLYWSAPAGLTPEEDRMAVQSWVEEVDWTYSPVPEGCAEGRMCGHYAQVVWRDTTHVGCASAQCPDGGGMWVCDYSPPGNFIGAPPF
ncbi:hypothetical protein CLOP_g36 [Closterium sp. NIES-67]|nr:hypothetical protein CLOP_g36 [Closterium sp. NIES-67]